MAFSSSVNVLAAFIGGSELVCQVGRGSRDLADIAVSFTLPYLLNSPYANLQSNIGWIYGSFAFAAGAFAYVHVEYTSHPSWGPWSLR